MQAAVLRRELISRGHQEILIHTGQHYDDGMSKIFFEELGIPNPDYHLGVGSYPDQNEQIGRMLIAVNKVIKSQSVDALVVDGDTNSTITGALAAAKLHIPLVHIEAGLRSFDRLMPEEINRVVTDHLSDLLCAPTMTAMKNLKIEGLEQRSIQTGDLMYDCFLKFKPLVKFSFMESLKIDSNQYILATIHREENTNSYLCLFEILSALSELPMPVVFPVHPRTRPGIDEYLNQGGTLGSIQIIDPIGYLEMLALELKASLIMTDSGGVQREAFFCGVPSIILRNTSEWKEQINSGWSVLVDANHEKILNTYYGFKIPQPVSPSEYYGDGNAAGRIVTALENMKG